MRFKARPYQQLIMDHIFANPRCAIWAGMGMGKTVSTLQAIDTLLSFTGEGPALIIAPLRVAQSTWPDEVAKWEDLHHLRVSVITGSPKKRLEAVAKEADIYTTNYENLPWLVEHWGNKWPYKIVVADESTRLKGFRTRQGSTRAKALAKVSKNLVNRFVELTGTPASNGLEDLWGQFWFLDSGKRLGSTMTAFHERWFRPERVGKDAFAVKWVPMPHAQDEIQAAVNDLTLKLNAEDWFSLEDPIVTNIEVTLPTRAHQQYIDMENEMLIELEEDDVIESANAAAKTGKCLQIASGAIYREDGTYEVLHDEKIKALESIVEESGGMPILVTYQFRHEAERILKAFPQARKLDKDPKTIRNWNAGKIPMLLAHPASCGHGLSLQDGGNILVFFSTGWNLEEHEQIVERIGPTRQKQAGHDRPVFIYNIVARSTLDETVLKRIETKREVLDLLLEKKHDH